MVLATQKAELGGLLEPRGWRLQRAMIALLQSSLGDMSRDLISKTNKQTNKQTKNP